MRHLIGLALAIVLAAALFFGGGWGAEHVSALVGHSVGLPSLVLLAWTALLAVSAHRALAWIPLQAHTFGAGFRVLLLNGTLALAGAAMIIPLFLPSRWHGRVRYGDEEDEDLGLPAPTGLLS